MKSAEIRQRFLDYFKRNGHEVVGSSSLVPASDPTLLFTNAGMVQFKDTFLGLEKRGYKRAASSQRCVRAGGKHNDLENVGYTTRHHTFFEMLGNFSFGDYFKREAIQFAWQFLTEELGLAPEKLWVTVYKDDHEAADIWLKEIGVDEKRLSRLGEKDNFWSMGDTGPCGPCSEIFYDHGQEVTGGPPGTPEEDGDRYVEIWNLVFMQYNRDDKGKLTPLPKPSVDTGLGLERMAAIMQGVHTNYDIDLFRGLVKAAADIIKVKDLKNKSLNVIADHIRAASFLITDGVYPSNEGRGYVLRRIIRRAIRHGFQLGAKGAFFYKMVKPLVKEMGKAYPELRDAQNTVENALKEEEERFAETIENGMKILEQAIEEARGKTLSGETVFQLYDTYGFPSDLTADVCRERGLKVDMKGFDKAMDQQRQRARAASGFKTGIVVDLEARSGETEFTGYEGISGKATVRAIHGKDGEVKELKQGEEGVVFLDRTPFYAESGGQVGDRGILHAGTATFTVKDTQKGHAHMGIMKKGKLKKGDKVKTEVDGGLRQATAMNHSATHLMHAALRTVLGDHVAQKGSMVDSQRTRFDFSHTKPITAEEIQNIEDLVNAEIRANNEVSTQNMAYKAAVQAGAMALFGEKYGDEVRVVSMGQFSTELCGGTHVTRTGDIGLFKITSEAGVAAGVRRIEAVTGAVALNTMRDTEAQLNRIAGIVKGGRDDAADRVEQLSEKTRQLEKDLTKLRSQLSTGAGGDLAEQAKDIKGIKVLATRIDGADAKSLRETLDHLKDKLQTAAVVLAAVEGKKVSLVAGVTKDLSKTIKAGDLVNSVASAIGGKGGGRPDMAQAGGQLDSEDTTKLDQALAQVPVWVESRMN